MKYLNKEGSALLMTILILNSIILVVLATASVVVSGVKMSGTQTRSVKAYFAAEAGAEQLLWQYRKSGGSCSFGSESTCNFGKNLSNSSFYQAKYSSGNSNSGSMLIFVSKGSFLNLSRSVELDLQF
jgi:hypothetical protein